MENQLLWAIILTILPVSELRGGLPIAIDYALKNNLSVISIILLIIIVNCLAVLLIFLFLDTLHKGFLHLNWYKRGFNLYLSKLQKKIDKFEDKHGASEFFLLVLLVAIPLPGTGAWTGSILSWILGLNRLKSISAIMIGVIIAGILVSGITLGIIFSF